ncbi:unnamed protein product [Cyprideis torosa]|uniref:Uncharacterized protein n=1 Tax=Cyprideis torosa TaxID=163714 RepID=A0A7R8ZSR8_9CRUS|nr:unnamed protein product [Cyprideis torosa]CAG0896166.1 unnamed protein product [Cyprideis torosa]
MLLTVYFFVLGVFALTHILEPLVEHFIPAGLVPFSEYHIRFTKKGKPDQPTPEEIVDVKFSNVTLGCMATSTVVGIWYLKQKHWIANNVLGLAFAMNGVEILQINSVITGCILLGGLFIYDVFWVFGTNVMVTVAKSFEAPVKLVFPQDLFEKGLSADNFAMLGLGDIVIPGIFIALLLRFDHSLKGGSRTYFYATFLAYFLGLLTTVYVMHAFKHAQPALLYLVPACLGTPFLVALFKGELGPLLHYKDHHGEAKTDEQVKKDDEPEAVELAKKNE